MPPTDIEHPLVREMPILGLIRSQLVDASLPSKTITQHRHDSEYEITVYGYALE